MINNTKRTVALALLVLCTASTSWLSASDETDRLAQHHNAKYVILMIGDGMGGWHVDAAAKHAGRPLNMTKLEIHGYMTTFARTATRDRGPYKKEYWEDGSVIGSYDPRRGGQTPWDQRAEPGYLAANATDSAASASAMLNGHKVVQYSLNVASGRKAYPAQAVDRIAYHTTIVEIAESLNLVTGLVTSVNFNHATPAAAIVKTPYRKNHGDKTRQLIESNVAVIMGAGHPEYDHNGLRRIPDYAGWSRNHGSYMADHAGEALFQKVRAGHNGRAFVQAKTDFKDLADGDTRFRDRPLPKRLFGLAQVADTLQYNRSRPNDTRSGSQPNAAPPIKTVPNLMEMTKGALAVLQQNPHGFWLLVEGGAIDWASHANEMASMLEELNDFDQAVGSVVQWVNDPTNAANWTNTLLIVTADHETGHLQPVGDATAKEVIERQCWGVDCTGWSGHTNALVPIYAQGVSAKKLETAFDGDFRDNTDIFKTMVLALDGRLP